MVTCCRQTILFMSRKAGFRSHFDMFEENRAAARVFYNGKIATLPERT